MPTFAELVASRKEWIESVLKPWCTLAPRKELQLAELEWGDIAGRVDPAVSLWSWAWSRFPQLVHGELAGVNETHEVRVTRRDGSVVTGYPDNRRSTGGGLVLVVHNPSGAERFTETDPISIDDIVSVERVV